MAQVYLFIAKNLSVKAGPHRPPSQVSLDTIDSTCPGQDAAAIPTAVPTKCGPEVAACPCSTPWNRYALPQIRLYLCWSNLHYITPLHYAILQAKHIAPFLTRALGPRRRAAFCPVIPVVPVVPVVAARWTSRRPTGSLSLPKSSLLHSLARLPRFLVRQTRHHLHIPLSRNPNTTTERDTRPPPTSTMPPTNSANLRVKTGPMMTHQQASHLPAMSMSAQQQAERQQQAQAAVERHKLRARKPTDKTMPDGVEDCVVSDGVQRYRDLRDYERRLDATITRKRLDVADSVGRNAKVSAPGGRTASERRGEAVYADRLRP